MMVEGGGGGSNVMVEGGGGGPNVMMDWMEGKFGGWSPPEGGGGWRGPKCSGLLPFRTLQRCKCSGPLPFRPSGGGNVAARYRFGGIRASGQHPAADFSKFRLLCSGMRCAMGYYLYSGLLPIFGNSKFEAAPRYRFLEIPSLRQHPATDFWKFRL